MKRTSTGFEVAAAIVGVAALTAWFGGAHTNAVVKAVGGSFQSAIRAALGHPK